MPAATTITVSDPALLAQLAAAEGQIVFRDEAGGHVRTVEVAPPPRRKYEFHVPYSEEELDEFSKQRTGRPLADILTDLKEKYGE